MPHRGKRVPQPKVQRAPVSANSDSGNATTNLLKGHSNVRLAKTVGRSRERHASVRLALSRAAEADRLRARSIHFESSWRQLFERALRLCLTDDKC